MSPEIMDLTHEAQQSNNPKKNPKKPRKHTGPLSPKTNDQRAPCLDDLDVAYQMPSLSELVRVGRSWSLVVGDLGKPRV